MDKLKIIILVIFVCQLPSCGMTGNIGKSDEELKYITALYQPTIDALEKYKIENGEYPDELNILDLKYTDELPAIFYKKVIKVDSIEYELKFYDIRQFTVLGDRERIFFVYRPSKTYTERKYEKPLKRVGDWALIRFFRTYGEDNPITGEGV